LSVQEQAQLTYELQQVLPYNHYCRKMLGYVWAMHAGATCIIDTDDDNIPYDDWDFPVLSGPFDCIPEESGFVNMYEYFSDMKIWPRGLPLRLINTATTDSIQLDTSDCQIGVWQGLADEDPDVDAIYRLVSDEPCYFEKRKPIVLKPGSLCPFNSQNTLVRRELFPLLYLPSFVTFRFTDILRGLVAQPIMWSSGYQLGFTQATVVQKRNPHDYMRDFVSEIPMFEHTERVVELVSAVVSQGRGIDSNLHAAYDALRAHGIVQPEEMIPLEAWLRDLGY
ncbi:MAG: STELLO glycosyltransferase family protein, partial [Flavobacteriales bacterium]